MLRGSLDVVCNDMISTRQGPKRMQGIRADIFSGLVYCSCGKRMQRKSPSGRGTALYYCMDRIAGITQCPSIPEAALTGPVIAAIAQVEHDTFDANATVAAKRETLFQAESKVKDIEARSERLLAAIEESGHNPLVISRLAKVEKERTQAEAEVIAAREALAVLPFKPPEWGREFAVNVAAAVNDKAAVEERYRLAAALTAVVERIVWHGTFAMIHTLRGPTLSINPNRYSLPKRGRPRKHIANPDVGLNNNDNHE